MNSTAQIRNLVDGVYDIQQLRIATGNRVVAALRPEQATEVKPNTSVDNPDGAPENQDDSIIKLVVGEYKRVADVYATRYQSKGRIEKALTGTEYIRTGLDYTLVEQYMKLVDAEEGLTKAVEKVVKDHPMWDAFFSDVKGCGPLMAAVCLAYLDPYKARHASSFWKYCGLDVVYNEETGLMEGRQKKHTEMREYEAKDGTIKEKKSLTYNPFIKTKLVGVLGSSFLRARGSYYGKVYYDYKNRLEQRDPDKSPAHRHRMATRYAVKMFLRDMWVVWRELEGLEVTEPYEVAKLGHKPHGT